MITPTLIVLLGFISWTLVLLILMEVIRSKLVFTKEVAATGFDQENSTLSPFMQRLARVLANCIEGLVLFGSLMVFAIITDNSDITNGLAYAFLIARLIQSTIHLISISATAITLRFTAFSVQMIIAAYWAYSLWMQLFL